MHIFLFIVGCNLFIGEHCYKMLERGKANEKEMVSCWRRKNRRGKTIIHLLPYKRGSGMMKKKTLVWFLSVLLIVTAVPTLESLKVNQPYLTPPNLPEKITDDNWTEVQKLVASDSENTDLFGWSVSLAGDTALIGAYGDHDNGADSGSAYVFTRTGSTWTQQQKLLASDGMAGDKFGYDVSLYENTALLGAPGDNDNGNLSGSAYVFLRTGTTWTQQAKLLASDGSRVDRFGTSVSLVNNTAIIGAPADDDNGSFTGSAYVFTRTGTIWTQQAKLLASDSNEYDNFGTSVFLDDDTALIGAPYDDDNGLDAGSAYVFTRAGFNWTQQAKLLPLENTTYDWFGCSLCLDGYTALIGAIEYQSGGFGAAYVFIHTDTGWFQQQKLFASDGATDDWFGKSVTLCDGTAFIGAPHDQDNGFLSGSGYMFTRTNNSWAQQAKLHASDGTEYDHFGCSICLDGDTALIGTGRKEAAYVFIEEQQPPVADFTWVPIDPQINQIIFFNASTSDDPDGSIVSYEWDWNNDGIYDELQGISTTTHSWSDTGSYLVTLRVTDNDGGTSKKTKTVTIIDTPVNVEITIKGGIGVTVEIINKGTTDIDDVPWEITVTGGILGLIHTTVNGTVDILVGESYSVGTGVFFGFGPITIIVNVADEEQTATGTHLFIVSLVKK